MYYDKIVNTMKNRFTKTAAFLLGDILIITSILFLASLISFPNTTNDQLLTIIIFCVAILILKLIVFASFRVYGMLIENFGVVESLKLMILSFSTSIISYLIISLIPNLPHFSIYLLIMMTVMELFLLAALRYVNRVFKIITGRSFKQSKNLRNTLVIGAGAAAKIVIDDSRTNPKSNSKIVALVDDDTNKIGGTFSGLPVKGPISDLTTIIKHYEIEEVIVAIADLTKERLKEIVSYLEESNVRIRRLPLLSEMSGVNDYQIIDMNLDELLGREAIHLDNQEVTEMLKDQVVLITGAGGSIGSELVRQIVGMRPKQLVLFDIYENTTYDIQQEIVRLIRSNNIVGLDLVVLIGSTYNENRIEELFKKYRPAYVYHAAAYKHVPLMEDSPMEAIRTNVIGAYNVAKMSDKYQAKKMVLVSTDKAVRPTNVMGATKRAAEMIIQYYANKSKNTSYSAVRFGNVLGSHGSVVPLFTKQIEEGGPVTITDPEINRFFMTIPEAVSLILQSSLFAGGGEIFILDMGKPVKIVTLAEKMIRQAGLIPYKDISIKFTGLRPGEKLYEEILIDFKKHTKTNNSKIFVEKCDVVAPVDNLIGEAHEIVDCGDYETIIKFLEKIVDTYHRDINHRK